MITLVQSSPSASVVDSDEEKLLNALEKLNLGEDGKSEKRGPAQKIIENSEPSSVAHITKLCASFVRATTLLTNIGRSDGAPY
jgi:hypothetical protein